MWQIRAGVEARAYCTVWKDHTRQKAPCFALPRIKQVEHLHLPPTVNTVGQSMSLFQTWNQVAGYQIRVAARRQGRSCISGRALLLIRAV